MCQGLHTQGSILASLSAMLPDAHRTLTKRPQLILPRRAVMERASRFANEHVERILFGDNSHPVPHANQRQVSAGNELKTITALSCGREGMKPNDGRVIGKVELHHVVLPGRRSSKHQACCSRDNPHVSRQGEVTEIVSPSHSDTVTFVARGREREHSVPYCHPWTRHPVSNQLGLIRKQFLKQSHIWINALG